MTILVVYLQLVMGNDEKKGCGNDDKKWWKWWEIKDENDGGMWDFMIIMRIWLRGYGDKEMVE